MKTATPQTCPDYLRKDTGQHEVEMLAPPALPHAPGMPVHLIHR